MPAGASLLRLWGVILHLQLGGKGCKQVQAFGRSFSHGVVGCAALFRISTLGTCWINLWLSEKKGVESKTSWFALDTSQPEWSIHEKNLTESFLRIYPNSLQSKPKAKRNMTERVFDSESFSIHWDPISTCADVSFCFFGDHVFGMCSLIWRCFWWNIFIYERESTRIWFIRVYAEIVWCRFVTWGLRTCRKYIYRL